jgi:hypothetical protein
VAGRPFDDARLAEVRAGVSRQQVLDALGAPYEIVATAPDGEVLRFFQRTQDRGCSVVAFGFIPMGDVPIRSLDASVHLAHGLVTRVVVKRTK